MTAIMLVSVIGHYHINGLHLFWNTQYIYSAFRKRSNRNVKIEFIHSKFYTSTKLKWQQHPIPCFVKQIKQNNPYYKQ